MAYLIFTTARGRELGRRLLTGSMVIGRSPDCDVCVHDILLSRHHCRLEQEGEAWVLVDLASKNGSYLGTHEIGRHPLNDGDTVRIGKTMVKYCVGKIEPAMRGGAAMKRPNKPKPRPADPWDAMNATVSGFDYIAALQKRKQERLGAKRRMSDMPPVSSSLPTPQPNPREPDAYQSDDIYSLLTELASSSWDSIYMNASRPSPVRPPPRPPALIGTRHPRARNASAVDLSPQQATPGLLAEAAPQRIRRPNPRWKRALLRMVRGVAAIGQSVVVLGIVHVLGKA